MKKKYYRLLYDRRLVLALSTLLFLHPKNARSIEEENPEQIVEMELKADPTSNYNIRRTNSSKRFIIGFETLFPEKYNSPADGTPYTSLVSSNTIPLTNVAIGAQINTKLGALFADITYSTGSISGSTSTVPTTIEATKYGVSGGLMLDTLFVDPYLSPFASFQLFNLEWKETAPLSLININGKIPMMMSYQIGMSVHLDKLEPTASRAAYIQYGLKNSFMDIFGTQTLAASSTGNPDFSTSLNWGINFRLEF